MFNLSADISEVPEVEITLGHHWCGIVLLDKHAAGTGHCGQLVTVLDKP